MKKCLAVTAVATLTACSGIGDGASPAQIGKIQSDIGLAQTSLKLQSEDIQRLENRVALLEARSNDLANTAYLDPAGGKGYQYVQTNVAPVIVSFVDSSAIGDGTRVRLQIGNLSSANFSGVALDVQYNKRMPTAAGGIDEWSKSTLSVTATDPGDVSAGAWAYVDVSLPGIKPDQLGYLAVKVKLDRLSLRQPR